jgi:cysteine-rich repeat protein
MKSTHVRSVRRPRRSAGLWLSIAAASLLLGACDGPSPAGYKEPAKAGSGGAGGSGGSATSAGTQSEPEVSGGAGAGGEGGYGDDVGATSSGGRAGSSAGGRGGSSGSGGGGGGGGSKATTTCGDGTRQEGEECDDGNTNDFDGCSSDCKAKCEACISEFYADPDDDYQIIKDQCLHDMTKATAGPSAGQPRGKLCQDLVRCLHVSGCAQAAVDRHLSLLDTCYCGSSSTQDCESGKADGACRKEIELGAESKEPTEIINKWQNPTLGLGRAILLAQAEVAIGYCTGVCSFGRALDDCDRCAAGDLHDYALTSAVCGGCFTLAANCSWPLSDCVRAKCSSGDIAACLSPTGPCADQVAAARTGELDGTKADLTCRATNCAAECFK